MIASIFLPLGLGYFLSFLYRSINAMIAPQLVTELSLSPSQLGFVTAVYFLTFGLVQLPLGLLLDRFGPALVQSSLLVVSAIGAVIFSMGETVGLLAFGRGMIGMGVAGALMSSFTAFALWLPTRHLPLANGCLMGFGGLGALAATKPVEWALDLTDWRGLFLVLAAITTLIALFVAVSLPRPKRIGSPTHLRMQLKGILTVYRDRLFWRIAPLTIASLGAGLSIQSLWAGTWLRDVAGLEPGDVATHLSVMAIGLTIGPVLSGLAASLTRQTGLSLNWLLGVIACLFMSLQFLIILEWISISYLLWAGFGLLINAMALSYAILSQAFPAHLAGRVNTSLNMLMIGGAFTSQYLIGWIIGFWPLEVGGGYAPEAYQAGFSVMLAAQFVTFIWFVIGRDRR
ncbi:MFS transporter [Rhodospirillales bacterium]|nr:MFS transporter [Rhodospirillales bacterium]